MRTNHLAAAALVSLSCAILSASCVQSPESLPETDPGEARSAHGPERTGEAQQPSFGSKNFPFVVDRKDDGKGEGGGWQIATTSLPFVHLHAGVPVHTWTCELEVGMPLRTELEGRISSSRAALLSAEIANEVGESIRHGWKGPDVLFCIKFVDGMGEMFYNRHRGIGARVRRL